MPQISAAGPHAQTAACWDHYLAQGSCTQPFAPGLQQSCAWLPHLQLARPPQLELRWGQLQCSKREISPVLRPASIDCCALTSCPLMLRVAVCPCTLASRSAPVVQRSSSSEAVMLLALLAAKAALTLVGWHVAHMTEGTLRAWCQVLLRGTWVSAAGLFSMRCPQ